LDASLTLTLTVAVAWGVLVYRVNPALGPTPTYRPTSVMPTAAAPRPMRLFQVRAAIADAPFSQVGCEFRADPRRDRVVQADRYCSGAASNADAHPSQQKKYVVFS
jgi:hypothetical protein